MLDSEFGIVACLDGAADCFDCCDGFGGGLRYDYVDGGFKALFALCI